MNILIGLYDQKMYNFIRTKKIKEPYKIAYKICNIKHLTCPVDIIIPFGYITNTDIISNTYVQFYELLLTLNVSSITYYNSYNEERLKEIAKEFNVPIKKEIM